MHVWNHLSSSRAIVLHNIVVAHTGDAGDGACQEGEPEAFAEVRELDREEDGVSGGQWRESKGRATARKHRRTDFSAFHSLHIRDFDLMPSRRNE